MITGAGSSASLVAAICFRLHILQIRSLHQSRTTALKTKEISLRTHLSIPDIKFRISPILEKAKIAPVTSSLIDEPAALSFLAERLGMVTQWAVQFYVFDRGDHREICIVALGDGGFSRAFNGIKNTVSLSKSTQVAEQLAAELS